MVACERTPLLGLRHPRGSAQHATEPDKGLSQCVLGRPVQASAGPPALHRVCMRRNYQQSALRRGRPEPEPWPIGRVTFKPESWDPPGPIRVVPIERWQRGRALPLLLRRASLLAQRSRRPDRRGSSQAASRARFQVAQSVKRPRSSDGHYERHYGHYERLPWPGSEIARHSNDVHLNDVHLNDVHLLVLSG
jgi:hypothetical protein